jgi:pSer/pThr/pTyr-binding forkhead associated (FHA) protein
MQLWLRQPLEIAISGPGGESALTVPQPFLRIGSDPRADVAIAGPGVARRSTYVHATSAGGIYAVSLQDGISGSIAPDSWLNPDQAIELGEHRLRVRIADRADQAALAPSPIPLLARGSATRPRPVLDIRHHGNRIEKRRISSSLTLVGRHELCGLRVDGRNISEFHCAVYWEDGCLWCIDLNSSMGTRLNGRRVVAGEVRFGDRIDIGHYTLTFERLSRGGRPSPISTANDLSETDETQGHADEVDTVKQSTISPALVLLAPASHDALAAFHQSWEAERERQQSDLDSLRSALDEERQRVQREQQNSLEQLAAERARLQIDAERLAADQASLRLQAERQDAEQQRLQEHSRRQAAEQERLDAEAQRLATELASLRDAAERQNVQHDREESQEVAAERASLRQEADRLATERVRLQAESQRLADERATLREESLRIAVLRERIEDEAQRSAENDSRMNVEKIALATAQASLQEMGLHQAAERERLQDQAARQTAEQLRLREEWQRLAVERAALEEEHLRQSPGAGAIAVTELIAPAKVFVPTDTPLVIARDNAAITHGTDFQVADAPLPASSEMPAGSTKDSASRDEMATLIMDRLDADDVSRRWRRLAVTLALSLAVAGIAVVGWIVCG